MLELNGTNYLSENLDVDESSYDLIEDTNFQGRYGSIRLLRLKCAMTEDVVKFCPSSYLLKVLCEALFTNIIGDVKI